MRQSRSAPSRPVLPSAAFGALTLLVAVPLSFAACAQGSVESNIPGLGGGIGTSTATSGPANGPGSGPGGANGSTGTQNGSTGTQGEGTGTSSTGGAGTTTGSFNSSTGASTTVGPATTVGPTSTSTSTSSSSSGMSSVCDTGDCETCGGCAQQGSCLNEVNDCYNDFGCSDIWCCAQNCSDNTCLDECESFDGPQSAAIFNDLLTCLDCACVESCGTPPGTCP